MSLFGFVAKKVAERIIISEAVTNAVDNAVDKLKETAEIKEQISRAKLF